MDRKEAIEVVRKKVDYYEADKRLKAALEALIPELAESEDERIRKEMLDYFIDKKERLHYLCFECGNVKNAPFREAKQIDDFLAYLEKQKEQKPVENTPSYSAAKKYFDSWIEMHHDSPTKWGCFWEGLLYSGKLSKPAEWTDADEKILGRIIDRQKFVIPVPGAGESPFLASFERREDTEAINWLKRRVASRPQPKQEWSEEDEENFKWFDKLFRAESIVVGGRDIPQDKYLWFKALRPHHTIRWRRATEGANIPESIIIPDGEEPRFGKCAVRDSYYIPISELKELPKE